MAERAAETGGRGAAPPARPGILASFGLFRDGGYRAYWIVNFVYFLVFGAQRFAFVLLVLELSERAGLGGVIGFALGIPVFFITVPAGVWADRLDRRKMVAVSLVAGAAVAGAVSALWWAGAISVPVAMGLALATGVVTASVQPPLTSIVQMIVPSERLTQGIVLRTMGQNLAQFFGTAVGGLTIAALDYGGAFAVLAAGYLVGVVAMLGVRLPIAAPSTIARPKMAEAAREGLRFVFSDRALRGLVIFSVISGLFMLGPTFVLIPEIGREKLQVGPWPNSMLLALLGVGMFAMSLFLLTRREVHRKGNWFVINLLFAGPLMILTGWSNSYWFTAVVMVLWGLGGGVYVNLNQTLIQTNTPNAMMGRVMSIYTLSIAGIIPLGSLLAGGGAAVIGADRYQMLSGAVLGLAAVWGFFTQRELRALD